MLINTDTILTTMREWVENKQPIAPDVWMDGALKLNVLISSETDLLYTLEHNVAVDKMEYRKENDSTMAEAEAYAKTTDDYLKMKKQDARVKQIQEFIRLAKKYATLKSEEIRSGL